MRFFLRRSWGAVVSTPWLVSANVHAAVVLALMCSLAPLAPQDRTEFILATDDQSRLEFQHSTEILLHEISPVVVMDQTVAAPAVREIEVLLPALLSSSVSLTSADDAAPMGDLPTITSLWVRVAPPRGEMTGLHEAGVALGDSGKAGGGSGGGEALFFGTTAFGTRFVYVLDMSGSMKEGGDGTAAGCRFRRAVDELLRSVDRLSPDQAFYVYLFSTITRPLFDEAPLTPIWRPATPANKQLLRMWLATIEPDGGTDPRTALLLAMALRPDAVFVLSDGRFNGKEQTILGEKTARRRSSEQESQFAGGARPPFHTFAFEDSLACNSMQNLALQSGGVYRFVAPIYRRGKSSRTAPIKDEVIAENLLVTAESLERSGRTAEAREKYREVERDFPHTPAAEEAVLRTVEVP